MFSERLPGLYKSYPALAKSIAPLLDAVARSAVESLPPSTAELISLHVSVLNDCGYCAQLHAEAALALEVSESLVEELLAHGHARLEDEKLRSALDLARTVNETAGYVTAEDFEEAQRAGWSQAALVQLVALVSAVKMLNSLCSALGFEREEGKERPANTGLRGRYLSSSCTTSSISSSESSLNWRGGIK